MNQTALAEEKRGQKQSKNENEGELQKKECVEGWERRSLSLSGRRGDLRERAVWDPGWKEHAQGCTTEWFGQHSNERKPHSWFLHQSETHPNTDRRKWQCVAMERCSTKIRDKLFPPMPIFSTLLFALGPPAWWLSQLTLWHGLLKERGDSWHFRSLVGKSLLCSDVDVTGDECWVPVSA